MNDEYQMRQTFENKTLTKDNICFEMLRGIEMIPEAQKSTELAFAMNQKTVEIYRSVDGDKPFNGMNVIPVPGIPDNSYLITDEKSIIETRNLWYALKTIQNDKDNGTI